MQQACEPLRWKCTTAGLVTKHMGHLPSAGASDNHALNARCQALLLVIVPTACAAPRLLTVVTVVQQGELRSLLSPQLEFSEMVLTVMRRQQQTNKHEEEMVQNHNHSMSMEYHGIATAYPS